MTRTPTAATSPPRPPPEQVSISGAGLSLRLLEIFVSVAQDGSMSAAAERLSLTQAAVSQSILSLEGVIGTQLFDRSIRPLALTLAGTRALREARAIVGHSRALLEVGRNAGSARMPLLRIGMLNSFATTAGAFVLDQLRDLADEWTVVSGFHATTYAALQDRISDVIITTDESPVPEDIVALPLFSEPFMVAVPSAYRGRTGDLLALGKKLEFIHYGRDVHMSGTIHRYLESLGARPSRRYQFDTTDAALHMVSGGFGWTIVSPLILLKSPSLLDAIRIVRLKDPGIGRHFVVAMRKGDSPGVAERIRAAVLDTLDEVVLPRLKGMLPALADTVRVVKVERHERHERHEKPVKPDLSARARPALSVPPVTDVR